MKESISYLEPTVPKAFDEKLFQSLCFTGVGMLVGGAKRFSVCVIPHQPPHPIFVKRSYKYLYSSGTPFFRRKRTSLTSCRCHSNLIDLEKQR